MVTDLWVWYKQACKQANAFTYVSTTIDLYHRNNCVITINYNRHVTMMKDIYVSARLMHTIEKAKSKYCSPFF